MDQITTQLADALRALHHQCDYMGAPADHEDMRAATDALAAYGAQQMAEQVKLSNEIIGEVIAEERAEHTPKGWDRAETSVEDDIPEVFDTDRFLGIVDQFLDEWKQSNIDDGITCADQPAAELAWPEVKRRIKACANACAGIDVEALERDGVRQIIRNLYEDNSK